MTAADVLQLSLDAYIALSLILATLWLYSASSPFSLLDAKNLKDRVLSTLLLVHTLYMLHALLVSPPQNIFKSLQLPLNVPSEYLHAKLVEAYGGEMNIPSSLAALPKRLGLMDLRAQYVRFGHEVIASCFYCRSSDDFALYAFPTPLSEYIREIAFIGILTLPRSLTSYLRPLGLGVLLASLLAEIYWTLTVQVTIPPFGVDTPVTMWHDTFVQLRHALFLVLPLLIGVFPHLGLHRIPILGTFVPTPPGYKSPPANQFQLQGHKFSIPANVTFNQMSTMTLQTLGHLLPTLHLLKYTHGAVMRLQAETPSSSSSSAEFTGSHDEEPFSIRSSSPSPHALATEWWADEAREGRTIRTDKDVLHLLNKDGLTSEEISDEGEGTPEVPEGHLLLSAKMAIKMLKEQGARPSEHWAYDNVNNKL